MQHVTRLSLTLLLTATLGAAFGAKTDGRQAEYKRSDTNYYWKGDVLKAEPGAVIVPMSEFKQKGDSYFTSSKGKNPAVVYVQVENDWIEPITPPSMPASLGVAPDAMQIREPQGDVTVALPSAPANFVAATDNMTIPNGAVVKTGANGTAAVLMGGVDSIRLTPNSSAAVQQTVTADMRTTEIDLTNGAIFSKVGKRIGEKQDYQVHTPFGVAAAKGTDFVTVAMPARVDVWIAQGTVQLDQPDGKMVGTVTSEGTGALRIIRNPLMPDAHAAMMASSQTMTAALNFIPTVNVYVKALDEKMSQGVKLTPTEKDYMGRIKKVPCLIKLALIAPPAPPPVPASAPVVPTPGPAAAVPELKTSAPMAVQAPPGKMPVQIRLTGNDISLNGVPITADSQLIGSLAGLPSSQSVVVVAGDSVSHAQLQRVMAICKDAKLTNVKRVKSAPEVTPPAASTTAEPVATQAKTLPTTPKPMEPVTPATPPAKPATPPPMLTPIDIDLRPDAKVDYQGATYTLDELKPKLQELGNATPTQPLNIIRQLNVKPADLKKLVALCHSSKLTKVMVTRAAPNPAAPAPAPVVAAAPVPPPAPAAPLTPIDVEARADGKVDFQGSTLSLDEFKAKLDDIAKTTPNQPLVIKRKERLEKGQLKKITEVCHAANLNKVTVDRTPPPAPVIPPVGPLPAAAIAPASPPNTVAPPAKPAEKPLPPAMLLPINIDLRPDGKVDYQGATYALEELKPKLQELGKTTPKQPITVTSQDKVPHAEVKKVVALCHEAKLTKVTVAKATPPTAPAVAQGATPAPVTSTVATTTSPASPASSAPKPKARAHASASPISTGSEYTVP